MDISDSGSVTSSGSQQPVIPSAAAAISSVEMARLQHQLIQATQKITAAYAAAERTKLAQVRFMTAACHDLRQPLQALVLLLDALKREVAGTRLEKITDIMQEATDDLNRLLDSATEMVASDMSCFIPTCKGASQQMNVASEHR